MAGIFVLSLKAQVCFHNYFLRQPAAMASNIRILAKIRLEEPHSVGVANAALKHINLHQVLQAHST